MPPPPPPSKSYHLVIIDSSDEEEEVVTRSPPPSALPTTNHKPPSFVPVDDDALTIQEDDDDDSEEMEEAPSPSSSPTASTSSSPKRKRKKRKKKKKKSAASASASTVATIKHVDFDHVLVRTFGRTLGEDVVPGDGGWPLGLDYRTDKNDSALPIPMDEYEEAKRSRLVEKWKQLQEMDSQNNNSSRNRGKKQKNDGTPIPDVLETRQWDYRRPSKNPLFGILSERERMRILLDDSELPAEDNDSVRSGSLASEHAMSDSIHSNDSSARGTRSTRSRSNSFHDKQQQQPPEEYNHVYTQVRVHHVRNELETIRNERTKTGCTCRKLHVYLPPPGSGKKAARSRLAVSKLTQELRNRNLLPTEQKTREELEVLLHDAVEKEPCCGDDCTCVKNGIECQDDSCTCWHASHQQDKKKKQVAITVDEAKERCGNVNGMCVVDIPSIDTFRQELLCQLVKPA